MKLQNRTEIYQQLMDLASISGYRTNQRVQLKMPKLVVELLDQEFPKKTRSRILTEAALELLIRKIRTSHPELEQWVAAEQYDLDRMWTYLHEREKK